MILGFKIVSKRGSKNCEFWNRLRTHFGTNFGTQEGWQFIDARGGGPEASGPRCTFICRYIWLCINIQGMKQARVGHQRAYRALIRTL